jgi:serine/threonine protein kinase
MNYEKPNICPECGNPVPTDSQHHLCPSCLLAQAMASQTQEGQQIPSAGVPEPDEISGKFPQLEILECLGRGGMGVVYKAVQKSLNRLVAIKILAPEREHDAKFAGRFAREAELLAKLSHPHIVTIHDFGESGGLYYLMMEYVDGVSLRDLLRDGKLEPQQALAIVPQICDALQFAHDRGIVHRDIKPENILLNKAGQVKIADFGVAKIIANELTEIPGNATPSSEMAGTEAGKVIGTPQYMAPEQLSHPLDVDNRADIYALGVVFYQMLTGELPVGKFEPPSRKVQIDVRLDEVVLRALEKEPGMRYQQASVMKTQVETIVGSGSTGGEPTGASSPPARLLRTAESLYATPEYLATTWGAMKLHENAAVLHLYTDRLEINLKWRNIVIPLRELIRLQVVSYPRLLNLGGLHALEIEFIEAGLPRRLLLTPGLNRFSISKRGVHEWFDLLRATVIAATGKPPAGSATPAPYQGFSSDGLFWAKSVMIVAFQLGPVILLMVFSALWVTGVSEWPGLLAQWSIFAILVATVAAFAFIRRGGPAENKSSSEAAPTPQQNMPSENAKITSPPRFSRMAIVGACWSISFVVSFVVAFIAFELVRRVGVGRPSLVPIWVLLFGLPVALLGLTAPFGTTILGWIAVSQIRRSCGKLRGMGLAVFDGLFFPLLVLDGAVVAMGLLALGCLDASGMKLFIPFFILIPIVFGTIALVDFLLIRAAWREVNKPTGKPTPDAPTPKNLTVKIIAVAFGVLVVLLPTVPLLFFVKERLAIQHREHSSNYGYSYAQHATTPPHAEPNAVRQINNAPFVARLPDGGSIELLAVRLGPSTSQPWWQPDGTPSTYESTIEAADKQPRAGVMALVRIKYHDIHLGSGLYSVVQYGMPFSLVDPYAPTPTYQMMSGVMFFEQTVPPTGNEATLSIQVATQDWTTLTTQTPGFFSSLFSSNAARKEWKFSETALGALKVTVDHLTQRSDMEYRFVAVDTDGQEHLPSMTRTTHAEGDVYSKREVTFEGVGSDGPLLFKNFREIRLEARPYQVVEFRNVSLRPGHKTTVEVKDFGDENASAPTMPAIPAAANPGLADASHSEPNAVRQINNAPFVARLNRGEVELAAIGDMPWSNPVCWLPNGQPSAAPFPLGNNFEISNWSKDMVTKKIAFYIRNEGTEGISTPICRISQESGAQPGSSSWTAPDKLTPYGRFGQIIVCPKDASTMNISLGVANGTWETAITLKHENNFSGGAAEGDLSATWQAVTGKEGDVAVSCSYKKNEGWESRMVYVDDTGKVIPIQENSTHVDKGQTGATLLVSSSEFAHIKEFRLQRRKYQWGEFRNVSLQPGHATTVEVKDFGGENPSAPTMPATPAAAQNLSFGPVIERVVTAFDENPAQACLDLGSGEFRPPPAALAARIRLIADKEGGGPFTDLGAPGDERYDWLKTSGVDLIGCRGSDGNLRFKYIGQPPHYQNGWTGFDAVFPNEVIQTLQSSPFFVGDKPNLPDVYINSMNPNDEATKKAGYIVFRTHDGDVGVMKVLGTSENPPGVKIRYKLVQSSVTTVTPVTPVTLPPAASQAPIATNVPVAAFGPVIGWPHSGHFTVSDKEAYVAAFGPVIEHVLPMDKNGLTSLFDVDHDKLVPDPGPGDTTAGLAQLFSSGLVVSHDEAKGQTVLLGMAAGTVTQSIPAGQWETMRAAEAAVAIDKNPGKSGAGVMTAAVATGKPPLTFLFKTPSGKVGLWQVEEFTENSRNVKIRYKLVQTKVAAASQMSEPADLSEARVKLATLRINYGEQAPIIRKALARVNELERMSREEPNASADLREAKANLAELRVDYSEQHPRVQEALAKIKAIIASPSSPR